MLPWKDLLQLTANNLGWSPEQFWSATLKEVKISCGLPAIHSNISREAFDRLVRNHPDQ